MVCSMFCENVRSYSKFALQKVYAHDNLFIKNDWSAIQFSEESKLLYLVLSWVYYMCYAVFIRSL